MPDIFLSYSRDDQATARRFAAAFERAGLNVWWDATLNPGEAYDKVTELALEQARAVVVLWSRKSVESRWVRAEATQANSLGTLVPVMIEACKRPIMFELTHTADLSNWNGDPDDKEWLAYLAGVRRFVDMDGAARASGLPAGGADKPASPRRAHRNKRIPLAIGGILALLVIAGGAQWLLTRARGAPSPAPTTRAAEEGVSLAVLPFVDMSPQHDQDYFSDGLSEELLNQLAQIKDLRLTARTSSFSFKGKNEDVRAIGAKLGVAHILEGSVRKSGDELRITAQLIDTRDGTHLWSQTYDRKLTDVFAVQDEIAKAVSRTLSIALDVGDMSRARGGTTSVEAYDKYLHARELDRRRGGPNDFAQGAQYYRDAVAIDPEFIRAWADLYSELDSSLVFVPENAVAARAEMAKILEHLEKQAPGDWRTRVTRGFRLMEKRQWREAGAELAAARASGADLRASAINLEYIFLLNTGRLNEALPGQQRKREADPLSLNSSYAWQIMLYVANRDTEAQAEYERSKALEGNHALADSFTLRRMMARPTADPVAIEAQLRRVLQDGISSEPLGKQMLTALRDPKAGAEIIRRGLEDPANQTATGMLFLAGYADYFGERVLALQALHRSFVDLKGTNVGMLWQPWKSGLRAEPGFKQLLRDIGLVEYFRASGNWGDLCKPVGADDFECR